MTLYNKIRDLIVRYQQSIFSLVTSLIGGDRNVAYDIAVESFVKTLSAFSAGPEDKFFVKLVAVAIESSRKARAIPLVDESDFNDFSPEKRKTLHLARAALQALSFETKVFLLLRDQLHLPYKLMGIILRLPERVVRIQTAQARVQLRTKIEDILRQGQ